MHLFSLHKSTETTNKTIIRGVFICILFSGSVLTIQLFPSYLMACTLSVILICLMFFMPGFKTTALTCCAFIWGFILFEYTEQSLIEWLIGKGFSLEFSGILSRLLLVFYLILLLITSFIDRRKPIHFWRLGNFRERLSFPFIWKGFDHPPIWLFIIIFSIITSCIFLFILYAKPDTHFTKELIFFSLLFAGINAPLEEIMWRGFIFSRFIDTMGVVSALLITSLGFGLYHYALGIPLLICLAFGLGSVYMAGLTVKSNGLLPVILFHFVLNFWMFMSGAIHPL